MLLSINPEHVENIINGRKKYEFRKIKCKSKVDKIVIYATSPIMKIVGEADVLEVIEGQVDAVWEKTAEFSGISKNFYNKYYQGKKIAVAYHLGTINKYEHPLLLSDLGIKFAPQSFVYL